jgi:hypothetical protein
MPKTQRFAGDGLVGHGHHVPGTSKSDETSTQVGQSVFGQAELVVRPWLSEWSLGCRASRPAWDC